MRLYILQNFIFFELLLWVYKNCGLKFSYETLNAETTTPLPPVNPTLIKTRLSDFMSNLKSHPLGY